MNYAQLLEQTCAQINEIMPWDLPEFLAENPKALIVDVREAREYDKFRIAQTLSVPRGILESACTWGFDETIPRLAAAQHQAILLICRSGNRSALAALSLQQLGFEGVLSLKLGLRGLNDEGHVFIDANNNVLDIDLVETWLNPPVPEKQRSPSTTNSANNKHRLLKT